MFPRLLARSTVAAILLLGVAPSLSADEVVTQRDNFGEDLAFIDRYFSRIWPEYYRAEGPLERGFEFGRDDVYVGRYDVNGDGRSELFVHFE